MKRAVIIIVVVSAVFTVGIAIWPRDSKTELMPGFWSETPEDLVRRSLEQQGFKLQQLEQPRKRAPGVNYKRLHVANYSHLGITGELQLDFFNNQLVKTGFIPGDPERYFDKLRDTVDLLADGTPKRISNHTRVRRYKDYWERPYVFWEDERLARELSTAID